MISLEGMSEAGGVSQAETGTGPLSVTVEQAVVDPAMMEEHE